ncbi:MAG: hypothetical protein ACRELG_08430 [Gemmataceae bacterium]
MLSLLKQMRGRLGMYVGTSSVIRLAAFLRGYDLAMEQFGGGVADPFLLVFRDWIHQRFQSSQHSWEDTILQHSADEADAVKRFWELLDEFVKEHPQVPAATETVDTNGIGGSELGSRVGTS